MKKIIVILLFSFCTLYAQSTWYVAARSGLNLREKPDPASKVIQLVPYGKEIKAKYAETFVEYTTENFKGSWWEAEYQGKKGYVFSEFLFSIPPPDTAYKYLQDYIKSFPLACGPITGETVGTVDGLGAETNQRYLTKNGILYYTVNGYEYGSFVCILPAFDIYRAFHLIRLFKDVKIPLGQDDDFPTSDRKTQIDDSETFTLKIIKIDGWLNRLELGWDGDGYPEQMNIYSVGGEIVIEVTSGF